MKSSAGVLSMQAAYDLRDSAYAGTDAICIAIATISHPKRAECPNLHTHRHAMIEQANRLHCFVRQNLAHHIM
jgi:hypothetical protein